MKQLVSGLCAMSLCFGIFSGTAFATQPKVEKNLISDWARPDVQLAQEAGLVTEHTKEYMTGSITRYQFAELIVNLAEKATGLTMNPAPANSFDDTRDLAVLKAYYAGIVDGVGNGKFAPNVETNREQIAKMIYNTVVYIEQTTGKEFTQKDDDLTRFTDKELVSTWAVHGVGVLANNGIMNGATAITLEPNARCTIEQSIIFIYRLFNVSQSPIVPPIVPTAYYKNYAMVPDYGVLVGKTPRSQRKDSTNRYFYEYAGGDADKMARYINLLGENGFYWLEQGEAGPILWSFAHKNVSVELQLVADGGFYVAINDKATAIPAGPVAFYAEGVKVPDFAAATGISLVKKQEGADQTQYSYSLDQKAMDNHFTAYLLQLLESGYTYREEDEGSLAKVWKNDRADCKVEISNNETTLFITVFPPKTNKR